MSPLNLLGRAVAIGVLGLALALSPAAALDHHEGGDHAEHAEHAESMGDEKMAMEVSAEVGAMIDNLARTGKQLKALAEATPEDKFSWAPNDEGPSENESASRVGRREDQT